MIAATGSVSSCRAAMAATSTIPIVFNSGEDPVEAGLVDNLNRPKREHNWDQLVQRRFGREEAIDFA